MKTKILLAAALTVAGFALAGPGIAGADTAAAIPCGYSETATGAIYRHCSPTPAQLRFDVPGSRPDFTRCMKQNDLVSIPRGTQVTSSGTC